MEVRIKQAKTRENDERNKQKETGKGGGGGTEIREKFGASM